MPGIDSLKDIQEGKGCHFYNLHFFFKSKCNKTLCPLFKMLEFLNFFFLVSWRFFSIRDSHVSFSRGGTPKSPWPWGLYSSSGYMLISYVLYYSGYDLVGDRI